MKAKTAFKLLIKSAPDGAGRVYMINLQLIADAADVIVNGYSFTKTDIGYRILNLNNLESAAVLTASGEVLETSMDDIELRIVREYLKDNLIFMED